MSTLTVKPAAAQTSKRRGEPGRIVSRTVVALSSCYAVLLLTVVNAISEAVDVSAFGDSQTVRTLLTLLAICFLAISVVISTVVITNTYSIITAGRVNDIARRRLLGSSARNERKHIAVDGLTTGVLGTVIGSATGALLSWGTVSYATAQGFLDLQGRQIFTPGIAVPCVAIVLCTWWAAWRGSRGVLQVSPIQGLGVASLASGGSSSGQKTGMVSMVITGCGLVVLVAAALLGTRSEFAVLLGLMGGTVTVIGFIGAAHRLIPGFYKLCDRIIPQRFIGLLASRNLQRYPLRTSRASLGVVMSVAVVTMFVVALAGLGELLKSSYGGLENEQEASVILNMINIIVLFLISFSIIISAIGMCNSIALNTQLRQREIGLMRVLGQSSRDSAAVIYSEAARMALGSAVLGLIMGTVFGWVGLQSSMGSVFESVSYVPLSIPPLFVLTVLIAASVLTVLSALAPSRRALSVPPIQAISSVG